MPQSAATADAPSHRPSGMATGAAALVVIPSVEVFRAGDYGSKGAYTPADLETIAQNYSIDRHHAPVTRDHLQSGPADGWVSKLVVRGKSLFADLAVTADMAQAIRDGKYLKRSIELYREFGDTAKPYLKAVSFLGAMIPHVKGMPDPVFAAGEAETFDFSADAPGTEAGAASANYMEEPPPPTGAKHGTIVHQSMTGTTLEHYHNVYLDADGNGYTSPPVRWEAGEIRPHESDRHQHIVESGRVLPATSTWGVEHTHDSYLSAYSDDDSEPTKEQFAMPKTEPKTTEPKTTQPADPTPAPAAPAPEVAQFADLQTKVEALERRNAELERVAADAAFAEAFDGAVKRGAIVPALKGKATALFHALRESAASATVTFAEGGPKLALHTALLTFFGELQVPPPTGSVLPGAKDGEADPLQRERQSPTDDPAEFSERELKLARKYSADNKCTLEEAFTALRADR